MTRPKLKIFFCSVNKRPYLVACLLCLLLLIIGAPPHRVTLRLSCHLQLQLYPFDSQKCYVKLSSCEYTITQAVHLATNYLLFLESDFIYIVCKLNLMIINQSILLVVNDPYISLVTRKYTL